ncbi:MAG: phage tail tape measure protein [Arcobacteraceae bacterium]|jgi:TP901 family phage tail tape measure protein|nr:phage tail tape measure protein [Arcobacteraceae bacterium]
MSTLLNIGIVLSATDLLTPVFQQTEDKLGSISANLTKIGTASLALGEGITSTLGGYFNNYQELRSAQGELKTLGVAAEGIDAITKSAKDFSNQFAGGTAPDFIRASYDIKSGIASLSDVAVGEFTSIAALTANATKSSVSQMTSLFATGYGIYRSQFDAFGASTIQGWESLSDEEKDIKFGEYFSAGIASTVQAFKTDGSQMSASLSNLGASATSAGVAFAEQLSILGQLQKTMSGSEAATKYRAFLDSAYGAGEKLGLTFTDANNQLLTMPDILGLLKEKYGNTIDAIEGDELKKAFGTEEAVGLIKLLYSEADVLTENINQMNLSLQEGSAKTRQMALAANEGRELEVFNQKVNNLTSTLGSAFAPVALFVTDVLGNVIGSVTEWMQEHEDLSKVIVGSVGVVGIALSVLGSLGVVMGGISMVLPFLSGGFGLVTSSMGFLITATKILSASLLTNPIGWIALAIAGAAYIIYSNWEPISNFFSNLWQGIVSAFDSSISFIRNYLGWTPLGIVMNNWNPIVDFFKSLWDSVVGFTNSVWQSIVDSVVSVVNLIKSPFESFFNWINEKFKWFSDTIGSIVDMGKSILGGIFDTVGGVMKSASSSFVLEGGYGKEATNTSKANEIQKSVMSSSVSNSNEMIYQNRQNATSQVVKSEPTYNITVNNPSSNVDVVKAMKEHEKKQQNRQFGDM